MAIYASNTFEAGVADGTAVSTANSGGAAGRAFDQLTTGVAYSTAQLWHGHLTGKFDQVASTSAQARWVDASNTPGTCYARWYMYITAAPAAATRVMHFALANGTQELAVRLKTDRHLDLLDSASAIMATSTTVIPTGAWVRVEAKMVPSASAGQGELKIFTTPDSTTPAETLTSTAAWNTGSAGSGMWRWGPTTGAAATFTLWLDDLAIAFDAYIGPSSDARSGSGTASAATGTAGTGSKRTAGSGSASLASGTSDGGSKATTGTGTTTATATASSTGTRASHGTGTTLTTAGTTGTGTHAGTGSGALTGVTGLTAGGARGGAGTGAATAGATVTGTGAHAGSGTGALTATSLLAGTGGKVLAGAGPMSAAASVTALGSKRATGTATLTAIPGLGSAGTATRRGTGLLTATAILTSTGIIGHQDLSHLSGTARVVTYSGTAHPRRLDGTARVRRLDGDAEV